MKHNTSDTPTIKAIRTGYRFPVLGTLFAVLVVACVAAAVLLTGGRPKSPPLRIAINPWPGYEFATLARELGYFEQEGVAVKLIELSSLDDSRRALERGQVDGMFSTLVEVISYGQNGRRAEIALIADASDGADVILARSEFTSIADLRGKRIAVEAASLNEVVLMRALSQAGLTWNDVQVVYMPALEMPRAFTEAQIDAAVCYPPMSVRIAEQGAREVFSTRDIPGIILDALAFDDQAFRTRSRDIAAFRKAFFRAMEYSLANPDTTYPIMAARQGITAEQFREVLTSGITLINEAKQKEYFGSGGKLQASINQINKDLRAIAGAKKAAVTNVTGQD